MISSIVIKGMKVGAFLGGGYGCLIVAKRDIFSHADKKENPHLVEYFDKVGAGIIVGGSLGGLIFGVTQIGLRIFPPMIKSMLKSTQSGMIKGATCGTILGAVYGYMQSKAEIEGINLHSSSRINEVESNYQYYTAYGVCSGVAYGIFYGAIFGGTVGLVKNVASGLLTKGKEINAVFQVALSKI